MATELDAMDVEFNVEKVARCRSTQFADALCEPAKKVPSVDPKSEPALRGFFHMRHIFGHTRF
jgi:hypothetical protein